MVYEVTTRALLALLLWVPVGLFAFGATKPLKALLFVLLGGVLFMPERAAFDPPLLPPFDKNTLSTMVAFCGAVLFCRQRIASGRPMRGVDFFFVVILLGAIGTVMTNRDPLSYGGGLDYDEVTRLPPVDLPALTNYDILSMSVREFLFWFAPFFLGRAMFRTRDDGIQLCKALVVGGLVYVPLMLIEMRFSPQLHYWVYGYYANFFGHAMRGGGFKPTVFMDNGLAVGMFVYGACFAAAILHRQRQTIAGFPAIFAFGALWLALLLSRNVGANVYALATLPMVLVVRGRMTSQLAVVLMALVVSYPLLRSTGTFPTKELVDFTAKANVERAQSLAFRFENEDLLLSKATERPWFGWGGFGRNRVFDERGKDITVTDGEWIIALGANGRIGFIGMFGLLLAPIVVARRRGRRIAAPADRQLVDALSLLVAVNAVDLLPNALFNVVPIFLSGALAGLANGISRQPPPTQHTGPIVYPPPRGP
jgi:hypothetical protein